LNDSWLQGRVKELHRETPSEAERVMRPPGAARAESPQQSEARRGGDAQQQALQMLSLAQRTAEEHVAGAQREADRIQADARATAEQIVRDAQAQAETVRREADKSLSDARAGAARIAEDARASADNARRDGEKIVSEARARAAEIAKDAQASADRLKRQAQLRYEEMVGNLEAKREALQQQIKALQEFDRDYRGRLLTFMQAQLRALWVDDRHADAETETPGGAASAEHVPSAEPEPEESTEPTAGQGRPADPA
jgi:cell division septum initiation protein DivIVA